MPACFVCNSKAVITRQDNSSRTIYNCEQCGVYVVSDLAQDQIKKHRHEVSAFLRHRQLAGNSDIVLISYDKAKLDKGYLQMTVSQIVELFPASFSEQMDRALENLALLSAYPGDEIKVESLDDASVFYLRHESLEALSFVIRAMMKESLIEVNYFGSSFFPCGIIVSPAGWDRVAAFAAGSREPRKDLLLLMGGAGQDLANDLRGAGQKTAKECGMRLITSDMIALEGMIGNGLEAAVRSAEYILIDLSFSKPESYFAMGYARALGKQLLVTCHENRRKKLEIDPARNGVVFWDEQKLLQLEYFNFIKARPE